MPPLAPFISRNPLTLTGGEPDMTITQILRQTSKGYARARCRLMGRDPDEFVCYGPAAVFESGPVEREAPMWVMFCPFERRRLIP